MKLMFWGKDSGLAEKVVGHSPVDVSSTEEEFRVLHILSGYDVKVARLLDEVKCPRCGAINQFDLVRSSNLGIIYCECLECYCEITNGVCDDEDMAQVSQDEWDTIVFSLCKV